MIVKTDKVITITMTGQEANLLQAVAGSPTEHWTGDMRDFCRELFEALRLSGKE
jgi:hypothetical protein